MNWTYPAKKPNDRTTSRTVVWTGACCPTRAQATRGRVFDGKESSDNTQERACTCTRPAARHRQLAEPHHASGEDHRGLCSTPTQQAWRTLTRHVRMGAHRIRRDGLTQPPSSHPIIRRRADPLEPGGSIVGHTTRRGFKATVLSCANGAMTDRLSQC